jgi:hypothetical protein
VYWIILLDFNEKVGTEQIFKAIIENESLHEIRNDNGIKVISKHLTVKSAMFPHRNTHKHSYASPDGKIHNQINYVLIDTWRK